MSFVAAKFILYSSLILAALIAVGFSQVDSNDSQLKDDAISTSGYIRSSSLPIASTEPIKSEYRRPQRRLFAVQDSCFVPPQPANGVRTRHRHHCGDDPKHCNAREGLELAPGSLLDYTCDPGYKLNGSALVLCEGMAEWSQIPNCVAAESTPLNSTTMTAKCYRFGRWVDCSSSDFLETPTEEPCHRGNTETVTSKTIQNETVNSNNDGKWKSDSNGSCGVAIPDITTDFPWRASLYRKYPNYEEIFFRCGATIIRNNLLLTAANCLRDYETNSTVDSKELFVMTGNSLRDYNHPLHESKIIWRSAVKNVYVHCDYHGEDSAGDIALLEIENSFEFSSFRLPACLEDSSVVEEAIDSDAYGSVAEFGATLIGRRPTGNSFTSLKSVPYLPHEKCNSSRKLVVTREFASDKFCTGFSNRSSTVCITDLGGGLMFQKHGLWYVIGVVTSIPFRRFYNGLYGCENYAIHTNVTLYMTWIQDVISNLEPIRFQTSGDC